jgi:hypothetical protein
MDLLFDDIIGKWCKLPEEMEPSRRKKVIEGVLLGVCSWGLYLAPGPFLSPLSVSWLP